MLKMFEKFKKRLNNLKVTGPLRSEIRYLKREAKQLDMEIGSIKASIKRDATRRNSKVKALKTINARLKKLTAFLTEFNAD